MTALFTAFLALFASSTPSCAGRITTTEYIHGALVQIEQPYCRHRPIRHRIKPDFMQLQQGLRGQVKP